MGRAIDTDEVRKEYEKVLKEFDSKLKEDMAVLWGKLDKRWGKEAHWRPDGWENPKKDTSSTSVQRYMMAKAFEQGATAMLEALRKQGEHYKQNGGIDFALSEHPAGTLIFIPDEPMIKKS